MASSFKILTLLFLGVTVCSCLERKNLGGLWTLVGQDVEMTIDNVIVPGGVFSDLMDHGIINDTFYGNSDTDYRWVGNVEWIYSSEFTVDEEFLSNSVINVVFEGLDTFATVLVNGVQVGTSNNMFVRYVFNVKDQLKAGTNDITVHFSSPIRVAEELASNTSNKYVIPPECPAKEYNGICHANRIRKMQASFSWDWGPAFASVGIWKDVYLEGFKSAAIEYVVATPTKNSAGDWIVTINTYFNAGPSDKVVGQIYAELSLEGGAHLAVNGPVDVSANEYNEIMFTLSLGVPEEIFQLWWPNGYGDQNLYNLNITFTTPEGDLDSEIIKIGFRTIELIQESIGNGLSFYFKVNGHPIFAMGANEIPINILPEKGQDKETIRRVLQSAKDVNMNMLRVWGGGVYESDYFYDLTDEFGILIWEDFMFACAMYPADSDFLSIVREEVRHQLKRLGSHTSIALWAGNNENESALSQSWYNTSSNFETYKQDYLALYVGTIEPEVVRILPNAIYTTSSPSNGQESDQEGHVANNPSDPLFGDVHFYDYLSDSWSVSTFPIPRFASEYGYQSMPAIESWLTATNNLADLNPCSDFMMGRQHHPDGNTQNLNLISNQLQLPDTSSDNYVAAYIYFSQIVQAQSIKVETEHYRSFKGRLNDQQHGNTMGALYWQLNDVWVAPTWSGMDFTGRWKMLQYYAQDFFSSMIVTGRLNERDQLEVYAIVDQLQVPEITVKCMVHIYKWDSLDPVSMTEYPVTLNPLKAVLITTIDVPTAFNLVGCGSDYQTAKANCFFHLHLIDQNNNQLVPQNYVFPETLKNSNLANANVQIQSITAVDDGGKVFDVALTTDVNALFVWLDSHGIRGRFSENGFVQVVSNKTVTFTAEEVVTVDELSKILTVTHLRDSAYL